MKIGVLGGTFDPIHNGHLLVAEQTRTELSLDEVIFVPTGQPWLKACQTISAAKHRVAMVRLAITDKPHYRISTIEVEREGPSYSVDTVADMKSQLGKSAEIYFIVGWDSVATLPRWHEPEKLVKMCYLVAVPRPGYAAPDLAALDASIPGVTKRVVIMDKPRVAISASDIRRRVAQGQPIDDLVPEAVGKYIKENGLYLADKR